jgi:heterodisulfide reductase subunit C
MVDTKALKEENKLWHQEHVSWMEEVEQWQHKTDRLIALLYMLDRALPEHSAMLKNHVSLIEQNEKLVACYECGIEERCFSSCPDFRSPSQYIVIHNKQKDLHTQVRQEHQLLKHMYAKEMKKFKQLAKKILEEEDF